MSRYEILLDLAQDFYNLYKDRPEHFKAATGLIAEGLHRVTPIHTGLISEEANRPGVKICKEHFFGRLNSAKLLMKKIGEGKWSRSRLLTFVKSRSRVHYTTSGENHRLKNYAHLHWRAAYKAANIRLVKFTSRRVEKHVYDIDGVVYNTKSALEKYAITKNALNYRCNKTSKKWSQWKKVKLQG
jgi:hypothetical protein